MAFYLRGYGISTVPIVSTGLKHFPNVPTLNTLHIISNGIKWSLLTLDRTKCFQLKSIYSYPWTQFFTRKKGNCKSHFENSYLCPCFWSPSNTQINNWLVVISLIITSKIICKMKTKIRNNSFEDCKIKLKISKP